MQRDDKFSFYNWIPYVLKLINQGAVPRQEAGGCPPAQGRHCVGTDRLCLQEPPSELTLRVWSICSGMRGLAAQHRPGGITCPSIHTQTDTVRTLLSVKPCLEHNASPSPPDLCFFSKTRLSGLLAGLPIVGSQTTPIHGGQGETKERGNWQV